MQGRLRWFGHADQGSTSAQTASHVAQTTGRQLKTCATTTKVNLEPLSGPRVFGYARWRKDWAKVSYELAQDRRAWSAST